MQFTFTAKRTADIPSIILIDNEDKEHMIAPKFLPESSDVLADAVLFEIEDYFLRLNPEFAGADEWYATYDYDGYSVYDIESEIENFASYVKSELDFADYRLDYNAAPTTKRKAPVKKKTPAKKTPAKAKTSTKKVTKAAPKKTVKKK